MNPTYCFLAVLTCIAVSGGGEIMSMSMSFSEAEVSMGSMRFVDRDPLLPKHDSTRTSLRDFSALTGLLSKNYLRFPDMTVSQSGSDVTISQLTCTDLRVEDVRLSSRTDSTNDYTSVGLQIDISGLSANCIFRWKYKRTILFGGGGVALRGSTHPARRLSRPPHDAIVSACNVPTRFSELIFDDNGLGMIGLIMTGSMRGFVEGIVQDVVCDELWKLAGEGDINSHGALDYLLLDIGERIRQHLEPLDLHRTSPVWVERNEIIPTILTTMKGEIQPAYMNFRELSSLMWINLALNELRCYLRRDLMGSGGYFGINVLFREHFLDEGGRFDVDPSLFFDTAGGDGVIFQGHGLLTEMTISILSIILGLDSFNELNMLDAIGNYTLRNTLRLDCLSVVIDMVMEMRSSSQSDVIIISSARDDYSHIKERFVVAFNVTDIEVDLSIFVGINAERLGDLELGSMLHTKNFLPCLLSVVDVAKVAELTMKVGGISPPRLSGFIDDGIDRLISSGTMALFEMYKGSMSRAIPNFFQTCMCDIMDKMLVGWLLEVDKCPKMNDVTADQYIDFRKMFQAVSSPVGQYGDVFPFVMKAVKDHLFASSDDYAAEDALLAVNDVLISPITNSHYGANGVVRLNGRLADLKMENSLHMWKVFAADNLRLTLSDLVIRGLDTFHGPVNFLTPRESSAHLLGIRFGLGGVVDKPLNASLKLAFEIGDAATSPIATNDVMDLQFHLPAMEVIAELIATLQESKLMKFPLRDLFNLSCWLSMIPLPDESPVGIGVGLRIHYFNILFDVLVSMRCLSCSHPLLKDLSPMVDFLNENDFFSGLKSRALLIVKDMLQGDWVSSIVERRLLQASQLCPHDRAYGKPLPNEVYPTFRVTRDLVDGLYYVAFHIAQVMVVMIARKHSSLKIPLPADVELDVPIDANLIDFTNLASASGWADRALVKVRGYLGGRAEDSPDLGISSIRRLSILDSDGLLRIPFPPSSSVPATTVKKTIPCKEIPLQNKDSDMKYSRQAFSLYHVTLVGLDSFTLFDILKAAGPTRLSNRIKLQTLGVMVTMELSVKDVSSKNVQMLLDGGLNTEEKETVSVSLILKDVIIDVSLLMALDQDILGPLKIGSIMNTETIFSCILSALHSINLSEFVMHVGDMSDFSISGFLSDCTSKSMQSFTNAIYAEYKQTLLDTIPAFTSITMRPILHDMLQVLVDRARNGACLEPDSSLDGIVDFSDLLPSEESVVDQQSQPKPDMLLVACVDYRDYASNTRYGNLFRLLYSFIENLTTNTHGNGRLKLNDLVASLTKRQSNERGILHYPGQLFKQDLNVAINGSVAAIELGVSDLKVSNLDSIGAPLRILQPVKGKSSVLNNTASIGTGSESVRMEFRLLIKGKGNDIKVYNDLVLGLNLKSVAVMLEVLVQIKEMLFFNFPLRDIMKLDCWLAMPDSGIVLRNLAFSLAEASLDIKCIECSSPLIVEMESMLGSQEAIADTTEVAKVILDYISKLLGGDFIQYQLDKKLTEAASRCPHSSAYNNETSSTTLNEMIVTEEGEGVKGFFIATICVIFISGVIVTSIYVVARCLLKRRHDRWVTTLNITQKVKLEQIQSGEKDHENNLNDRMTSLIQSSQVPLFMRMFIPVIILGDVALFLCSHIFLGGTVNISGPFFGQSFHVEGYY
ncbi:LOW QUALITY PROTEIN: hypothetical protein ACHAW5_010452 [Stephanodiscus triporus]|uniref:Lipid-binding serum glycoprotein C-terminal domain-containing protein n=1 Tax=Stephanodiscus triporus TaxID=2934178 RepID=A0ABD3PYF2_9STRA